LAARALDLCFGTTTPAGKFIRSIFASLAEYDRESILAKIKVGQQLAAP
jgi:DNA invertase Pin-like site-specific DNA recombinase